VAASGQGDGQADDPQILRAARSCPHCAPRRHHQAAEALRRPR
jgi:hypothetical protein